MRALFSVVILAWLGGCAIPGTYTVFRPSDIEAPPAHNGADICGRSSYQIAEFLIRLGQGERRATLIEQARDHARGAYIKAIAQYMLGSIDDAALREVLASGSQKMEACDAHFDALWYLELSKRHDKAQEHFDAMAGVGTATCGAYLFFARSFGYPPS
jgi:hypothetical protein